MKKLTLATSVFAAMSIVACAKSFKAIDMMSTPLDPTKDSQIEKTVKENLENTPFYAGSAVILTNKDGKNLGQLMVIERKDARAMFNALNISPIVIEQSQNKIWNAGKAKQGVHLECSEQSSIIAPNSPKYGCFLNFDYKTGEVSQVVRAEGTGGPLEVVPKTEKFVGSNVALLPGFFGPLPYGQIRISGKDAEALFKNMNANEKAPEMRLGKNIKCVSSEGSEEGKANYDCAVFFNYVTGQVTTMNENTVIKIPGLAPTADQETPAVDTVTTTTVPETPAADTVTTTTVPEAPVADPVTTTTVPVTSTTITVTPTTVPVAQAVESGSNASGLKFYNNNGNGKLGKGFSPGPFFSID